jgi:lipoate-protein ligase A
MLDQAHFLRFNKVVVTTSVNPHLNFAQALELLINPGSAHKILYLWRSTPTVTIGRHQNPYKECNLEYMKDNKVALLRRPNGGGVTYHDLGHTHWAFIDRYPDERANAEILRAALRMIGASSPIRSMTVPGTARTLHWGTFQLSDNALPPSRCLRDGGKGEIGSANLIHKKLSHGLFCDSIVRAFLEVSGDAQIRYIDERAMEAQPSVKVRARELRSYNWLFGKSSAGRTMVSRKFDFGRFDVAFRFEGPRVKQALVHSDCQMPEIVAKFEDCINLVGRSRLPVSVSQRIYQPEARSDQEREMTQQLVRWIMPEIKNMEFIR